MKMLLERPIGSRQGTVSSTLQAWFFILFPSHPSARCISKAWVCDGDSDCEDNSDEENCEALACRPPSHPCANNTSVCLSPDKLCDGKDDCGDGSDEGELCGTTPAGPGVGQQCREASCPGQSCRKWSGARGGRTVSPTLIKGLALALREASHNSCSICSEEEEAQSP